MRVVRALRWSVAVVVGVLVAWALMHALISPVNPRQEPPEKHVAGPCWACHLVLESAEIVEEQAR